MIDGIKFSINPISIMDSDILEFQSNGNRKTAKYKGLIIQLYAKSCYVRGSIHKYYNDGEHNYNDMKLSEFINTLLDLCTTLNINPETSILQTLEFGVNIDLPFNPHKLLNSIVYFNNGSLQSSKDSLTIVFTDYEIKMYLKTLAGYKDKMRFEVKLKRARRIKAIANKGVPFCSTIIDLCNSELWKTLGVELVSVFDSLLIVDNEGMDVSALKPKDLELYVDGMKPYYWLQDMARNEKQRKLKHFNLLIKKYNTSTIKEIASNLIGAKIKELIDVASKIKYDFPALSVIINSSKVVQFPCWWNGCDEIKNVAVSTIDKEGTRIISNPKEGVCEITGLSLDIGIKQNSYLSSKGVEYYYSNSKGLFDAVLYPRLGDRWKEADLKVQFREIAHSIRNEKYNKNNNPRNNLKRDIKKIINKGGLLFSIAETIREDKRITFREICL